MNTSVTPDRPWLDLAHQVAGIAIALVPVVLALHLLARDRTAVPPHHLMGFDLRRPGRDLLGGTVLAAVIGLPGLALYLVARMHPGVGRIGALLWEDAKLLVRGRSSLSGVVAGLTRTLQSES